MLSILIPTCNYDCTRLVFDLARQADALQRAGGFEWEIIVSDDASENAETIRANQSINQRKGCRYLLQAERIGPARNRNFLLQEAAHPWVLVVDCDAQVCSENFLQSYWDARGQAAVVVGGLRNPENAAPGHELRFRYEKQAERQHSPAFREQQPYAHFSTFNFMARRDVLCSILFDTRCKDYGYEDALMGLELQRRRISICHIDNPLVHLGIDRNEDFLRKTETALHTLLHLEGPMQQAAGASRTAHRLRRYGLEGICAWAFRLFQKPLRKNLLGKSPSLLLFKLYKLGFYCRIEQLEEKAAAGAN